MASPGASPKAPRTAIKFSTTLKPKSSSNPRNEKRSSHSSALGKRPLPRALGGSDSEEDSASDGSDRRRRHGQHERRHRAGGERRDGRGSEDDERRHRRRDRNREGRVEAVRELGGEPERKVIKIEGLSSRLPSRQARENGEKKKVESGQQVERQVADLDKPVKWGLQITKKDPAIEPPKAAAPTATSGPEPSKSKTADERALESLLGKDTSEDERKVIQQQAASLSEEAAFKRDFRSAPDPDDLSLDTGLDADEFGKAMLRGMGWKEDDEKNKKEKSAWELINQRRSNGLGLGASDPEGLMPGRHQKGRGGGKGNRPPKLSEYNAQKQREKEIREKKYRERSRERDRDKYEDRDRYRDRSRERSRR